MSIAPFPSGTILGYPRIGANRELKKAIEAFWAGRASEADTQATAKALRDRNRAHLVELGLSKDDAAIPADFSFYDHVLDTAVLFGAVPARFADVVGADGSIDLAGYSDIARGRGRDLPLEMTKWFDTNYHYLVPEISPETEFKLVGDKPVAEFLEAAEQGIHVRPVIVGPVTFLSLAKAAEGSPEGFHPLDRLADILPAYAELLEKLAAAGATWVQLDEPALVSESLAVTVDQVRAAITTAYQVLATDLAQPARPAILLTAGYGDLEDGLATVAATDVEAIALDGVKGALPLKGAAGLENKTVVAGVIDGHNIWRANLDEKLQLLEQLEVSGVGAVAVGTSTSLFHVPHTVAVETHLDETLRSWLAFADEKVGEVVTLAEGITEGREAIHEQLLEASDAVYSRAKAKGVVVPEVRERTAKLEAGDFTRGDFAERKAAQAERLNLPPLPTTTIGSFPQTPKIRKARAALTKGEITEAEYTDAMKAEIREVIELQERIGLDVLVHGEPERNDMVQYFAENLEGFDVTHNGWVQSYGSRCTRPSILWGDVHRAAPITVEWAKYAQSLSKKPVKGMLTGPVTILAWSFVRDDIPVGETANQVALALRDEIADLEAAGIAVVQVDEPALRELLPLKTADQAAYLDWSVNSFRLATSGVESSTQIHTHLCYSEFGEVIGAIDGLDADVTSIEAARSKMEILEFIASSGFNRGIGPGVYDIHSPRVPATDEVSELITAAVASIPAESLWINPDCGLKTRRYEEVTPSLEHILAATRAARAAL